MRSISFLPSLLFLKVVVDMAMQQNKANVREREPTERAPLLAEQNGYQQTPEALPEEQEVPERSKGSVIGIIGLLLIGELHVSTFQEHLAISEPFSRQYLE